MGGPESGATATQRQRIQELLRDAEWGFEELRRELETTVGSLEDDLRHVERGLRKGGERLRAEPARCLACGFTFHHRVPRHFHAPSRCPTCRSERISDPRFRIV
ncbi:MAG TPA: transcriptional regulator [Thermoanaerobaculia bacterium]|nr:transcriptional regulator [Thermoanaerobaculia bacterium]